MPKQKVIRCGHSLGFTIPFRIVKRLKIKLGDEAILTMPTPNSINIVFPEPPQLPLEFSPNKNIENKI